MQIRNRFLWLLGIKRCQFCNSKLIMTTVADMYIVWPEWRPTFDAEYNFGEVKLVCPNCKGVYIK